MQTEFFFNSGTKPPEWEKRPKAVNVSEFSEEYEPIFLDDVQTAIATGQTVLPITISSYGGELESLKYMLNVIKSLKVPIVTYTPNKAMSCGAVLFSAGTRRIMAPDAVIMVHLASGEVAGKTSEIKATTDFLLMQNEWAMATLDRNCGKPNGYFKKLLTRRKHVDLFLTAKEALQHGLATDIGYASFKVVVSQHTEVEFISPADNIDTSKATAK